MSCSTLGSICIQLCLSPRVVVGSPSLPVYEYITTGKYTNITVEANDIPDVTLKFAFEKVYCLVY